MAGLNLEVFKLWYDVSLRPLLTLLFLLSQFGMYVLFPIGIMYYFGTNLDDRFAVPDFWPKAENANRIPTEREEIKAELERLRARRLYFRDRRLAEEAARPQPPPTDETK